MFGIGFDELLVILIVAFIVVGPENIPRVVKSLGRAVAEFQRAMREVKDTIESHEVVREFKEEFNRVKDGIKSLPHEVDKNGRDGRKQD